MRDLDPSADWKPMRKAAKRIFQSLGRAARYPGACGMDRETSRAGRCFGGFAGSIAEGSTARRTGPARGTPFASLTGNSGEPGPKNWRAITATSRPIVRRANPLSTKSGKQCADLHRRAQKSRSQIAYHRLRVGLKKVSLRRGKFSALDVFRLGARFEIRAGRARASARPECLGTGDRAQERPDGRSRARRVDQEVAGRGVLAASSNTAERWRENRLRCGSGAKDCRRKGNCDPRGCRGSRNGPIF